MALYSGTPAASKSKLQRLEDIRTSLMNERSSFDTTWRDLGDYFAPRRTRFHSMDRNRGDRRDQLIIDSSPRFAARTLASGMHAGLTSPARPWMKLTVPDPDLAKFPAVKSWLDHVTRLMLSVFTRSNLYNCLPIGYGDMGIFGTAAMGAMADEEDVLRCYSYPIGSFAVGMDERGMPSTFVRDLMMTVEQIVEKFALLPGGKEIDRDILSEAVKNAWDRGDYQAQFEVTWIVSPNREYDPGLKLKREAAHKFKSCYYERGSSSSKLNMDAQKLLAERGFDTFPVLIPRWDVTGEDTYGTDCPGLVALGDNRQLQMMQKRKGQAVEKMVKPPMTGPESLRTQKTSLLPGDITYLDVREGQQGLRPVHEVKPDVDKLLLDIQATQYRIQRAFYEDLFLMLASTPSTTPITAREVEERHEEKLLALGPVLERTNDELLDPLIDRTFAIMSDKRMLPPPPEELVNMKLRVEYISLMAQAQRLVGVAGADRFLQSVIGVAPVFPEVTMKIRIEKFVDEYAEMLGVTPDGIVPDEEYQEAKAAQQEAAAAAQQSAIAAEQAKAAQALGNTPSVQAQPSALSDVLGGAV